MLSTCNCRQSSKSSCKVHKSLPLHDFARSHAAFQRTTGGYLSLSSSTCLSLHPAYVGRIVSLKTPARGFFFRNVLLKKCSRQRSPTFIRTEAGEYGVSTIQFAVSMSRLSFLSTCRLSLAQACMMMIRTLASPRRFNSCQRPVSRADSGALGVA